MTSAREEKRQTMLDANFRIDLLSEMDFVRCPLMYFVFFILVFRVVFISRHSFHENIDTSMRAIRVIFISMFTMKFI